MVCCVTGHRPKSFPFRIAEDKDAEYFLYIDLLYNTVEKLIYEGYSHFITGMADGADIHFLIRLLIVLGVTQRPVQIIVQILLVGGFVRIFSIVDDIFQPTLYGPESCCCQPATSSTISFLVCFRGRNRFWRKSFSIAISAASVSGCNGRLLISHSLEYTA